MTILYKPQKLKNTYTLRNVTNSLFHRVLPATSFRLYPSSTVFISVDRVSDHDHVQLLLLLLLLFLLYISIARLLQTKLNPTNARRVFHVLTNLVLLVLLTFPRTILISYLDTTWNRQMWHQNRTLREHQPLGLSSLSKPNEHFLTTRVL